MSRKDELTTLAKQFGTCGCKRHCQMEQYGEDGSERKPRGRFSVCEVEADKHDVKVPAPREDSP